jgi:hypothetical protein
MDGKELAGAMRGPDRRRGERVQAVAEEAEAREADAEHEHLQPNAAGVRIDELRDEREDEDDRLRVGQVDDDALRVRAPGAIRYAAPTYLTASNATREARIREERPAVASATWTTVPLVIPATEAMPPARLISMLRVTT